MGLMDWLTESMGNSAGAGSLGNPNSYAPPIPPVSSPYDQPQQPPGSDKPPMVDMGRVREFMGNSYGEPTPPPGGLSMPPGMGSAPPIPPGPVPGGLSMPPGMGPPPPVPPGAAPPMGTDPMGAATGFPPPPPPTAPGGGPLTSGIPPDTSGGQGFNVPPPPPVPGAPSPAQSGGIGSDAARAPNQPPIPPVPTPRARPPGAPGKTEDEAALPENATTTMGKQVAQAGQEINWLGKLLGVKTPAEAQRAGREISRGMAAAFSNAPSGVGKGKFAAFAGGVGAGMTGAHKEADREEESQRKYLAQKILANNSETLAKTQSSNQTLNLARTKLALEQAKAVMTGQGQGINSPQQLYLRAGALANNDRDIRDEQDKLKELRKTSLPNSPTLKAAEEKFKKLYQERQTQHLGNLGLDPKLATSLGGMPGLSEETALSGAKLTQPAYDALPVGGYFIDPKTKTLMRKPPAPGNPGVAGAAPGTPPTATPPTAAGATPPTPPAPVTAPAASRAAGEDEEADMDVG